MADKPRRDPFGSIPITGDDSFSEKSTRTRSLPRRKGFARRMLPSPKGFFRSRNFWLGLLAVSGGAYLLAGFLLVPYLIKNRVASTLAKELGRPVTIGQAAFNPLTLSLSLQNGIVGARLNDPSDTIDPLLSFAELRLELSPASLLKQAVVSRRLAIDRPFLHLLRDQQGVYNLPGLFPQIHLPTAPTPPRPLFALGPAGLYYSLNNITLTHGRLLFDDRPAAKNHRLEEITLALPMVGNIEYQAGQYLAPKFAATINGSPLEFAGTSQITGQTVTSSVALHLKNLTLADYLAYLPALTPGTLGKGTGDLDCQLSLTTAPGTPLQLGIEGSAHLHDLELKESNQHGSTIPNATLNGVIEPLAGRYHFTEITLDNPNFEVEKTAAGTWLLPLPNLFGRGQSPPANPTQIQIDKLQINDSTLALADHSHPNGFKERWSRLNLTLASFASPAPGSQESERASFTINAQDSRNGRWSSQGTLGGSPLTIAGQVHLDRYELPHLAPYLALPERIKIAGGQVEGVDSHFRFTTPPPDKESGWRVDRLNLQLRDLMLTDKDQPGLKLPYLAIQDGAVAEKTINLGTLTATAGNLSLAWEADGTIGSALLPAPPPADPKPANDWQTTFQALELNECLLTLPARAGNGPSHALPFALKAMRSLTADAEATLTATAKLTADRTLSLTGPLTLHPFQAKLRLQLEPFELESIAPFLGEWLTPTVAGTLTADGVFALPEMSFTGSAKLSQFKANSANTTLLAWQEAQSQTLRFDFPTLALSAEQIAVKQPVLNLTLLANDASNFDRFFKKIGPDAAEAHFPPLKFAECKFTEGRLDFANQRLNPPYRSQLSEVTGMIGKFEPAPEVGFNFTLQAKVLKESALAISGRAQFGPANPLLEMQGKLDHLPLPTLAPYLEPHFGTKVVGGSMDLSGNYRYEAKKIASESQLQLQGLKLGAPLTTEKGNAQGKLPFSKALLENEAGRLNLAIPISGETEKASPFIAEQLQKTLRNLLLKTAVSPIALLAETNKKTTLSDQLLFKVGESEFAAKEYEKLQELAKILADRPGLLLKITGNADQGADRQALLGKGKKATTPKKTAPDNAPLLDLAAKRGQAVKLALEKAGIKTEQLLLNPEPQLLPAEALGRSGNRVDLKLELRG